jgi:hypothetical protein
MKSILALTLTLILAGCAQTVLYSPNSGKRLASFQGDMTGSHYAGGGVTWDVQQVSHSAATLAQGKAASAVIGATGSSVSGAAIAIGANSWLPKLVGSAIPASSAVSLPAKSPAH